jgi:hypothetical protein
MLLLDAEAREKVPKHVEIDAHMGRTNVARNIIDQRSPCPLATLNPFGRELLLSDVLAGINRRPGSKGGLILSKGVNKGFPTDLILLLFNLVKSL